MSDLPCELSQEQVDEMQNEIVALLKAWEDRGIPVEQGAFVLLANANMTACYLEMKLGDAVALLVKQWGDHDGVR